MAPIRLLTDLIEIAGSMNDAGDRYIAGPESIEYDIAAHRETPKPLSEFITFSPRPWVVHKHVENLMEAIFKTDRSIDIFFRDEENYFGDVLFGLAAYDVSSHSVV